MRNTLKIVYLMHMPPPVHGVSAINELVFTSEIINSEYTKRLIKLNLSRNIKGLRVFSVLKLLRFVFIFCKLLTKLIFFRPNLVYMTIMPIGSGFIKDSILVFLLKLFGVKLVFHLHNRGIPAYANRPTFRILYRWVFKNASIIHLSNNLIDSEIKHILPHTVQTYVCANGVPDFPKLHAASNENTNTILFFSNLHIEKGIKTVLESFLELHNKNHLCLLKIGGSFSQEFKQYIQEYISKYPYLENKIELIGASFGINKQMHFINSDIFVLPTNFSEECMPLVILEAMAAQLPVIASDIGAINTLIDDGETGFLVEPNKSAVLTQKLERLISDKNACRKMGRLGREKYLQFFSKQIFEQNMHDILTNCLNS